MLNNYSVIKMQPPEMAAVFGLQKIQ